MLKVMGNRLKAVWYFITSPNYSRTVGILALLVVVLAIPLTVFIAQKQQEIRQRAAQAQCNQAYDGVTFSTQDQSVKDNFIATYGDQAEAQWIQQHNNELYQKAPKATDGQTLYDQTCEIISYFYSAYGTNAPQQWANQHNGTGGSPGECNAEEKTYTAAQCAFNDKNWFAADGQTRDTGWVDGPTVNVSCGVGKKLQNKGKYCDSNGKKRFIGSATCVTDSSCPAAPQVTTCGHNCALTNQDQGGKTAPSQCTEANTYFYVQTEGWPQGQCSTACLPCPAGTRPATDKCSCVAVPTLIPAPKPVQLCGFDCKSFLTGSIENEEQCTNENYYIGKLSYDYNTQKCDFRCTQIPDYGTINRKKANGCGYEAISKPAPPSGDSGGDGGGGGAAPAPGAPGAPGAPAPTTPPTEALTKLLFDLILPGGTKDKRIVAQIFTTTPATPTPSPTPTTSPDTTPAPTPTPTPTPIPNQLGQDLAGTVTRSSGGNHTGTVDIPNTIASGTYDIKVKADKYLRKLIKDVQTTQNTTTRISQITLVLGDINGDNKLDIQDYNILIDCFGANASSQACGNNKDFADLDDNGRVDGVDYNLFLRSMAKGVLQGD